MPVAGGGFEQAYNAQAAVDAATMLVVGTGVTQAPNDKEQIEPMLRTLAAQPQTRGAVKQVIADTGFYSEKNIEAHGRTPSKIRIEVEMTVKNRKYRHASTFIANFLSKCAFQPRLVCSSPTGC